jgi:hypothetical protein
MLVGACLFGYGVSSIVAIISDLYSTDAEFRSHMDNVNKYMASKKLPNTLRAEVREYMHRENRIRRSAQVTEEEEELIHAGLNLTLRKKLLLGVNRFYLSELTMLSDSPEPFLVALANGMRKASYKPGEEMITQGDVAEHAFIICYGLVEVVHITGAKEGQEERQEKRVAVLRKGQYCGEIAMFQDYRGTGQLPPHRFE